MLLIRKKEPNQLNSIDQANSAPLIALPNMDLSCFFVQVGSLPAILQPFSEIIPLTYGIRILKGIMLKGYGITDIWFEFAAIGFSV
ncbi:MAG: hypothetical protein ACFFCQ_13015 [Promethearchaeota archaeon]